MDWIETRTQRNGMSRREVISLGAMAAAALAVGCRSASRSNWQFFNEEQATTLTAICNQIIPADDYPSASQAGVITYIDLQLTRSFHRYQHIYRDSLANVDRASIHRYGKRLADASPIQQLDAVSALERENGEFFDLIRAHTMQGYYGSPRHGGNRDAASWHMLGLAEPPVRGRAQCHPTDGASR